MFKIKKVDHIGIAVNNLDEVVKLYENVLGLKVHGIETSEEQKVRVAFIPVGETELEFMEPTTPESTVAKFIEKNGQGIQHMCLGVDNIENALADLKAQGIRLINDQPRPGAGGAKIAFLHPKATSGVLVELSERK